MNRLPVVEHLSPTEIARRYRTCPDGAEKTRWQVIWLVTRPDRPMSAGRAALSVGLTASWGRTLLKRWNLPDAQGNIFNSGQDNESTVAVLALCTALALAVASLVYVCCLWASVGSALSVDISRVSFFACLLSICLDTSPPLTLRI